MKDYAGRVLMLVENFFPIDPRVHNEACTLTQAGYKVSVIALRNTGEKRSEIVEGVRVYRIPRLTLFKKTCKAGCSFPRRCLNRVESTIGYIVEYFYFTSACLLMSCIAAVTEGFDVVHAHNPPDTLFIVGALHKL